MRGPRFYRNLTGLFFIMAVISLVLASYTYQLDHHPFTAGSNPNSSGLSDAISAFDNTTSSLDLQIAQLQSLHSSGSNGPTLVQYESQLYESQPIASTLAQRTVQLGAEKIQFTTGSDRSGSPEDLTARSSTVQRCHRIITLPMGSMPTWAQKPCIALS